MTWCKRSSPSLVAVENESLSASPRAGAPSLHAPLRALSCPSSTLCLTELWGRCRAVLIVWRVKYVTVLITGAGEGRLRLPRGGFVRSRVSRVSPRVSLGESLFCVRRA